MASLKERASATVTRLRERHPFVDHVFRMFAHYGAVNGTGQAGAVTYFGFLSFFPILAVAFFVIGLLAQFYPDARQELVAALNKVLPGLIGTGEGQIPLSTFEQNASTVGIIGFVGLLYSGLGWLSGMRRSLEVMFRLPRREQPNFVVGKALDLLVLAVIGLTLIASVALSGAVSGFSAQILELLGLDGSPVATAVLWVIGHALAVAATTLLFVALFRLLAQPHVSRRSLLRGALLGALGFELLKGLANFLIGHTKDQPAFQAFGVALILLVWINYFSRIVMYGAAWAYTEPVEGLPVADEAAPPYGEGTTENEGTTESEDGAGPDRPAAGAPRGGAAGRSRRTTRAAVVGACTGAAATLAAVALKRHHEQP